MRPVRVSMRQQAQQQVLVTPRAALPAAQTPAPQALGPEGSRSSAATAYAESPALAEAVAAMRRALASERAQVSPDD